MAKAFECDNCGIFVKCALDAIGFEKLPINNIKHIQGKMSLHFYVSKSQYDDYTPAELCVKCQALYVEAVNNLFNVEGTKEEG